MVSYEYRYTVKRPNGELVSNLTEGEKDDLIKYHGCTLYATAKKRNSDDEGTRVNITPNLTDSITGSDINYYLEITGEANRTTVGKYSDYTVVCGQGNDYVDTPNQLNSFNA